MATTDNIVQVSISRQAQAVAQAAFSIPLIVGPTSATTWGSDKVRSYSSADALLTDGFTSGNPEYIFAVQLMSQNLRPTSFLVGKRSSTTATDLPTDLAAISAVNDTWYGLVVAGATDADILQAASYIEGKKKIHIAASDTAAIATSATSDLASSLKTSSYNRTALLYTKNGKTTGLAAGWMGGQLPQQPGANTWAFKNVAGIAADTLTDNEASILIGSAIAGTGGKNANVYQTLGGINVTQMGTMASGQFIDLTIGLDWLESRIKESVFAAIVGANKLPYTDAGVTVLIQAVSQVLTTGVTNGLIDGTSDILVSAPSVASMASTDRTKRIAPPITFSCRFSGALHAVQVRGTVTL